MVWENKLLLWLLEGGFLKKAKLLISRYLLCKSTWVVFVFLYSGKEQNSVLCNQKTIKLWFLFLQIEFSLHCFVLKNWRKSRYWQAEKLVATCYDFALIWIGILSFSQFVQGTGTNSNKQRICLFIWNSRERRNLQWRSVSVSYTLLSSLK